MKKYTTYTPCTNGAHSSTLQCLAHIFSAALEEDVTPKQTLCILHAILALLFLVFSLAVPFAFRLLCIAWFAYALHRCKQAGLGEE